MGKIRCTYRILVENLKGGYHVGGFDVYWRMILKCNFKT
jgi:hypothetical protein